MPRPCLARAAGRSRSAAGCFAPTATAPGGWPAPPPIDGKVREMTASAILDIATDRSVYGRAFLVAAVEPGMGFPDTLDRAGAGLGRHPPGVSGADGPVPRRSRSDRRGTRCVGSQPGWRARSPGASGRALRCGRRPRRRRVNHLGSRGGYFILEPLVRARRAERMPRSWGFREVSCAPPVPRRAAPARCPPARAARRGQVCRTPPG